jgi:uncharacterized protein (DUF58 family)
VTQPSPAASRAAQAWKLAWIPVQPRSKAGEQLGSGTGSSLEFQDRRMYQAGDDIRHLDWRAFARTGDLTVKLYREEILPRLDLLVDTSASMAVDEAKAQLSVDLTLFMALAARRQGFSVRVIAVGDEPAKVELDTLQINGLEFDGRRPLEHSLGMARAYLRPGTLRMLISDFLSPYDSAEMVRSLSQKAGGVALFQILSHGDNHPLVGSALRMEDSESGALRDIVLDAETVNAYLGRLGRLKDTLEVECRRAAVRFTSLEAGPELDDICRQYLARTGLMTPG